MAGRHVPLVVTVNTAERERDPHGGLALMHAPATYYYFRSLWKFEERSFCMAPQRRSRSGSTARAKRSGRTAKSPARTNARKTPERVTSVGDLSGIDRARILMDLDNLQVCHLWLCALGLPPMVLIRDRL